MQREQLDDEDLTWVRSPHSGLNGNCVEVARLPDGQVAVRNSRDSAAPAHIFTDAEWMAFLAGMKSGAFDQI